MEKRGFGDVLFVSRKVKILLGMIVGTIVFGTLGYAAVLRISLFESFVRAMETLTFSSEYAYTGGAHVLKTLIVLFGVVIIWFALETSFSLMIEGQLSNYFTGVRRMEKIKKLRNHYIVCGGGRVGEHVAELLAQKKKSFVLIEKKDALSESLSKRKYLIVVGDALDEEALLEAGVKHAKAVISVLPETEKNILVTLTAKELNPGIKIYSRADKREYVKKLHKAGADFVSMPEYSCADEIVSKMK